ncbi:Crp/Fnr family transcriptional regulator [Chitinophaga sedimenti]|uniref:Crp/Fnr family transcriptional regulator n=1 Tax=Chitinophaga sedimenti TaxID=2033606 RepID=UPI002002D5C3|nr:Crp/Fnr family transcriptional regulator [Chitinophaga sedimenti]MCK7554440.1 Crp/Fnr family transcriptional regulator [Chitinophaga sedimenti]
MTTGIDLLREAIKKFAGMDDAAFDLSLPYWQEKHYKKGEFYNEYRNVCKHLGFILDGVFRTYYVHAENAEEKNLLFSTRGQIIVSYKSFLNQQPCNYHTESMTASSILYIHITDLYQLYAQSKEWEKFGRLVAEMAFNLIMGRMEDFLWQTPEERYLELMRQHPDIFNAVPLYHIASYLGIQGPSLSRIRKRMAAK